MSWVSIIWSAASGACLVLGLIHLLIWLQDRRLWANLCFSVTVLGVVGLAVFEMIMMNTESPEVFGLSFRWAHVVYGVSVAGFLGFVHFEFGTGRRWLLALALGLRLLAVVVNFTTGQSLHVRAVHSLQHIYLLGEQVSMLGEWVPNPWVRLGQFAALMQLVYVVDASIRLWRKGSPESRKSALLVGGTLALAIVGVAVQAGLVAAGVLRMPFIVSFPFFGVLMVMGYELSRDVLRAARLARDSGESEQRMEIAANAAGLGLWMWEFARDEIWATPRCRSLLGFDAEERITFADFLSRVHADDREASERRIRLALERCEPYDDEYRLALTTDGERWMAASGRVERTESGVAWRMQGVIREITARKQAQAEKSLLHREIAHVGRVSMMGQLASALAHEINQPLGAILRNAEAAELFMQHDSPDLDETRAILADIRKDDQRASAVIDRMRSLLRRQELETRTLDVGEFIGDVTALARSDAATRRVKLVVEVPSDLPAVRGDRVHLQQVLLNLIINGMDAISDGAEGDRCVNLSARRDGNEVEIAVSDTGSGIPSEQLAHVFEPFFTTKANGMGMGLPISRTIIEAHDGRLWAENNGRGASFRFTLPIAQKLSAS